VDGLDANIHTICDHNNKDKNHTRILDSGYMHARVKYNHMHNMLNVKNGQQRETERKRERERMKTNDFHSRQNYSQYMTARINAS